MIPKRRSSSLPPEFSISARCGALYNVVFLRLSAAICHHWSLAKMVEAPGGVFDRQITGKKGWFMLVFNHFQETKPSYSYHSYHSCKLMMLMMLMMLMLVPSTACLHHARSSLLLGGILWLSAQRPS